ncbi:maltokinase N-terminal cap-like domain-containing protein [Arthrobacter psychrolactophilus]
MSDSLLALIAEWLPQQRWYPRKGDAGNGARLTVAERHELPSPDPAVTLLVLLLRVDFPSLTSPTYDVGQRLTLHVPLSFHRDSTVVPSNSEASTGAVGAGGVLGTLDEVDGWPGGRVHDGLADPAFLRAWLSMALGVLEGEADDVQIWRNPELGGGAGSELSDIRALGAEQSNTSIVFKYEDRALIAKFFRILQSGAHPEVEIGRALATVSGKGKFSHVPTLQIVAEQGSSGAVLCVIHDFIQGAQDGWEQSLAAAGTEEDFTAHAALIGGALAEVHANLREGMGPHWAEKTETHAFVEVMAARLEQAWEVARIAVGTLRSKVREYCATAASY